MPGPTRGGPLAALLPGAPALAQTPAAQPPAAQPPAEPNPRPLVLPQPAAQVTATMLTPVARGFTPDLLGRLKVAGGFRLKVVATGTGNARTLYVMPGGSLYLSRNEQGDVLLLRDANKNPD